MALAVAISFFIEECARSAASLMGTSRCLSYFLSYGLLSPFSLQTLFLARGHAMQLALCFRCSFEDLGSNPFGVAKPQYQCHSIFRGIIRYGKEHSWHRQNS